MRKYEIEKRLKRFLKRKISFSFSLIIAFLIIGNLSFASEVVNSNNILENDYQVEEINMDDNDFESYKFFFNYEYLRSGKGKDRTKKEFAETIREVNKYYEKDKNSNFGRDKVVEGNGVVVGTYKNEAINHETGVNIKVNGLEHPNIKIEIAENTLIPEAVLGKRPHNISISSPEYITITKPIPILPSIPSPVALTPVVSINIDDVEIASTVVHNPVTPSVKDIVINIPTILIGYEPSYIFVPKAPTDVTVALPTTPNIGFISMSNGNNPHVEVDVVADKKGGVQNSIISGTSVIDGDFLIKREQLFSSDGTPLTADIIYSGETDDLGVFPSTPNNSYSYSYKDYVAYSSKNISKGIGAGTSGLLQLDDTSEDKYAISYYHNYSDSTAVQRIVGSPYITFNNGKFTVARESSDSSVNLGEFLHMDIHSTASNTNIQKVIENTINYIKSNSREGETVSVSKVIPAWNDVIANYTMYPENILAWINSNDITLEGGNLSLTNVYSHLSSTPSSSVLINTGEVEIRPYKNNSTIYDKYNSVFLISSEQSKGDDINIAQNIMYNKGDIKTSTETTGAFSINNGWYNRSGYRYSSNNTIVNKGNIEMTGKYSLGVYGQFLSWYISDDKRGSLNMDFTDNGIRKPIQLYGDESIGLYITPEFNTAKITGNFHVDIGAVDVGNKSINIQASDTNGGETITDYWGGNLNTDIIEGSVGIFSYKDMNLASHGIVINNKTKGNIGVVTKKSDAHIWASNSGGTISSWNIAATTPTLNLGDGYIKLAGGEDNIGVFATEGNVHTSGSIDLIDGLKNTAVYAKGYEVSANKITTSGNVENSVVLFSDNGTINIENGVKMEGLKVTNALSENQNDVLAVYAKNGGKISINNLSANKGDMDNPDIHITGMESSNLSNDFRGIALMSNNGNIKVNNTFIKVNSGVTGIASLNSGKVETEETSLYVDNGYAIYSDGTGEVLYKGGKIILDGKSVAFDLELSNNPIKLTDTEIRIVSNDVTAVNLKNLITPLNISNLESEIKNAMGTRVTITSDPGITKYKIASVDGGELHIDKDINKFDNVENSPGNYFYKRFLGQKMKIDVANGIKVIASIDSTYADEYFKGQVVGLEMNSSSSASGVSDTHINLAPNSKVIANRTDAGKGAIGLYMNFGEVNLENTSKIEVEKENKVANPSGVGIYGVNGSIIKNSGDVEVAGNEAVGILGMAYREGSPSKPIVNEFGSISGQGKVNIKNDGTIKLDGLGGIGIYAYNNDPSDTSANTNTIVENTGVIKVGNSLSSSASIGIYGDKAIIKNTGIVSVGDGGVGVYAKNESKITDLGTLKLGADGVGVMADATSDITATSIILASNSVDPLEKTGIFYQGDSGVPNQKKDINFDIDASLLNNGTIIHSKNMGISSNGILKVGQEGIGIYINSDSPLDTAENKGSIILDTGKIKAVGMYTAGGKISNTSIIDTNDSSQIAMFAQGINSHISNTGSINLNAEKSTGMYVKDGAQVQVTGDNIIFNKNDSVGIYAEKASVKVNNNLTFSEANQNKNILIYGKDADISIENGNKLVVDGITSPANTGNKTVGVYLEKNITQNEFKGEIEVTNEAVGIYSKGKNNLITTATAIGKNTTGIFLEGGADIEGNITAQGGAVGIYAAGSKVNVTAGGLTLKTGSSNDIGTGMYLVDGAYTGGDLITLDNISSEKNIGLYYKKGSTNSMITNEADIDILKNDTIGIYAASGINLLNTKNITTSTAGNDNIAVYIEGDSKYNSDGDITLNGSGDIGIYTESGIGTNSEGKTISLNNSGTSSIGMAAETTIGQSAEVQNIGTINGKSNLGMYIAGSGISSGKNSGNIITTSGTGVYVNGLQNSFDGTNGSISSNGIGMYLKNTETNKITAGNFNIGSGGVGVYGDNAKIDFAVNAAGSKIIGVAAENNTVVSNNIIVGEDSIGVYVLDNTVTFNGASIVTGRKNSATPVGILLKDTIGTYSLNNVSVDAKDGIGIYLGNDIGATTGVNLTFDGKIKTENGVGIYIPKYTVLTTGDAAIDINGGTGIYIDEGTANLGTTKDLIFNFGKNSGIGIFNNGGNLTVGNNVVVNGLGSFGVSRNGSWLSTGNFSVGEGSIGLLGEYDSSMLSPQNITNTGDITVVSGGIGLAAITGQTSSTDKIDIVNKGNISVSGESSDGSMAIGMYSETADIENSGSINVESNGIGIYSNAGNKSIEVKNDKMNLAGTEGIGIYLKGADNKLVSNNITSKAAGNTGVVLEGVTENIDAGTITLGNESIGLLAVNGANTVIAGEISVGDGSKDKNAIGVAAAIGSTLSIDASAKIKTGNNGIGVYAEDGGTVVNIGDVEKISVGDNGVYIYSAGASVNFTGNLLVENQIGIVANGGSINSNNSSITVKDGGIGIYVKNIVPDFGTTNISIKDGREDKYSIGVYYDSVPLIGTAPTIIDSGNYTIGMMLNNSKGITTAGFSIGATGVHKIALLAKNNSSLTVVGNVAVLGDNNVGIYGEDSSINILGDVLIGDSSEDSGLKKSSIGTYLKTGLYRGNGSLTIGNYGIGVYAEKLEAGSTITQTGNDMTVGKHGIGIFSSGSSKVKLSMNNKITMDSDSSIGVYTENADSNVTGNMKIGSNSSMGILSLGNGNVEYSGDLDIMDKEVTASAGIYKKAGSGNIITSGNWNIGNSGYGIYVEQDKVKTENSVIIDSKADMELGTSAIGIYSSGKNIVKNSGNIIVGATNDNGVHLKLEDFEYSVGIYLSGGSSGLNTSLGNITVNHEHSVGVYVMGEGTSFINEGIINVDNGGIGILVQNNGMVENKGTINLGDGLASTIGIGAYNGGSIFNTGVINVGKGTGIYIADGANLTNAGTINVNNGIGVEGKGTLVNSGDIIVTGNGISISDSETGENIGSVIIKPDGTIYINDKYVAIGGTLTTVGSIVVNGAYVDVTTKTPLFNASNITGEVKILPNFALTGNGISYEIKGFVNTASGTVDGNKLAAITSPMFTSKITDKGNLVIAKIPYADLTIGGQYDALDKGLDNILKNSNGIGRDAEILKGLNSYLDGLPESDFAVQTERKIAQTRGDIYATIQGRMQDINRAFDNSFYEMESSYNFTDNSNKFSVIYTDGNYKDGTTGIDDYDYKVMGLMYMKEKENSEDGNKYGYTLGFAGSKFKFKDDGSSKEDVYSLRAGVHRVKNLSEEHRVSWLTRAEFGYNRHIAKRKLALHKTFENKGEYNTYSISLDNKINKVIYKDTEKELNIYGDLNLEYGKVGNFAEKTGNKGGLEVRVKDNDYLSAEIGLGVKGKQRIYSRDQVSVKVIGDVKYAYDLGDNYDGNKAKLKNGQEGYYSLITPEKQKGAVIGKIGLAIEKEKHMGVTFEVEATNEQHKKDTSIRYGVRFNYKF